jgi:flagellar hook assembly protein FlgD
MRYRIPAAAAVIRVRIFDSLGRLVRTLADGEPAGSEGDLVWDGFDDDRRKVRMGIYVVLLEARGSDGESTESVKTTVVVAAKL